LKRNLGQDPFLKKGFEFHLPVFVCKEYVKSIFHIGFGFIFAPAIVSLFMKAAKSGSRGATTFFLPTICLHVLLSHT
jgi:hypothetical protein